MSSSQTAEGGPVSAPLARRHPTILDVASRAGVSKSTVSNVVRGSVAVAAPTRERVLAAIEELGYRPNVLARELVQQRTSLLGVVVGDLANPFYAEMAKSVERHASARGYHAMFCNTEGDSENEIAGVEMLLQHRVAGIVFLAFSGDRRIMQQALGHRVPVVFISCAADWGDVVAADDTRGAKLATEHLIGLGHRNIAYISIPELEERSDRARWEGYSEALAGASLGAPTRISWSPPSPRCTVDGRGADLHALISGAGRVTAVFAANDVAAIALQEFADSIDVRVPEQLSIVGFDDVPMAGLARIALTTVAQPREELARLGIATIADRIEHRLLGPPKSSLVEVALVTRGSASVPGDAP